MQPSYDEKWGNLGAVIMRQFTRTISYKFKCDCSPYRGGTVNANHFSYCPWSIVTEVLDHLATFLGYTGDLPDCVLPLKEVDAVLNLQFNSNSK